MSPKNMLILAVVMGFVAVGLLLKASGAQSTVVVFQATAAVEKGLALGPVANPVKIPLASYEAMKSQVPSAELEQWVRTTPLARPLAAGETVTFEHFVRSASRELQIAAGKRAIAIEVNAARAVGFVVRPGDLVDVLGTLSQGVREGGRESQRVVSKVLLQAKRVLAVGQQYRTEDSAFLASREYSTVTLEVTPDEAQKLAAARPFLSDGFMLTLRAPGDAEIVPRLPDIEMGSPQFDVIGNR